MKPFKKHRMTLSAVLSLLLAVPAGAAPAGFAEGVRFYNARQYNQALACFTRAAQAEPNNATVRYYMGLSYQGMNQMTQAKQQYQWVWSTAARSNPALAQQAGAALQNLSRYQTGLSSGSPVSAPSGAPAPTAVAGAPAKLTGKLKILYFTTDW
jgi:tetratricopeptide (TPR) repeat protein